MDYSVILADRILALCKECGWNVNKLAGISGLRQSSIDNIIQGSSKNPQIKTLHRIANAFGMTLAEFLDIPELNRFTWKKSSESEPVR